ncbi:MAG TPA: PD-(D/E)XK nuclease family protein [Candidatus Acidoferrales bacterium]|nr:PD-(D/E)XK nuclease family protein [Candidatus Acidoferrales bacterium]
MQGRLWDPAEDWLVTADSPEMRAFVDGVVRWCRTGADEEIPALIRSPHSGVPHDVGAAYATLANRSGPLLDAIDRGRLALPAPDRDAVLLFAERLRRLRAFSDRVKDEPLRAEVERAFELRRGADSTAESHASEAAPETIGLADPAEPEAPRGVPPRQRHFSASALNAYAECARKWFYRYACAAVEDRASAASTYGTAFHLALEDFHGEFPRPSARDEAAMRARIRENVRWAFERNRDGFEARVEFELQLRRAQRTAQRYVDWLLAQERDAPFEVIGREVPANLELDGHAFVGFIDRLDRDARSGGIGVVDYKTGSIATSAQEYRDAVRRFEDFQLPFYYWARTAEGDRVTRLALIPLKDALLDVRPIVLEVTNLPVEQSNGNRRRNEARGTIGVSELERARTRMIELAGELSSGTVERFEVARDPDACTFCAYATACAHKPAPEPERFGR